MENLKIIQLLQFIKSNVDDDYSMQVLNYTFRRLITNPMPKEQAYYVRIGKYFSPEPTAISVFKNFSRASKLLPILMSIRAISINPDFIGLCRSNELIFETSIRGSDWRYLVPVIKECAADEDFNNLLSMFNSCCEQESFTEQQLQLFEKYSEAPKAKYRNKVLAEEAKALSGDFNDSIIGDNAFLWNDDLMEYEIGESIQFVGDTAFAYCKNLKEITIVPKGLAFGKFPIIECPSLNKIVVPDGCLEYYAAQIPFYKDIIVEVGNQLEIDTEPESEIVEEFKPKANIAPIEHQKIFQVFEKRATSYKFFWLASILSILKRTDKLSITMEELVIEMVSIAWPIMYQYDISLGSRDMLKNMGDRLIANGVLRANYDTSEVRSILKTRYKGIKSIIIGLLKNVPYRFLSPWIHYTSDTDVIEKSQKSDFGTPYAIHDDFILLDEDWHEYFIDDLPKIKSFIINEFYSYLKAYNTEFQLLKFKIDNHNE